MSDDVIGKLVAYVGAPFTGVTALETQAANMPTPEAIPLMAVPVPVVNVTIGDCIAIGSFLIVAYRLYWDLKKDRRSSSIE